MDDNINENIDNLNEDIATYDELTGDDTPTVDTSDDSGTDTQTDPDEGDDGEDEEEEPKNKYAKVINNAYKNYNKEYKFTCKVCNTVFLMTTKQLNELYDADVAAIPVAHCPNCDNTSVKGVEVTTHSKPGYI